MLKPELKPGIYRHFKGNEYKVIDLARHSETEEWMVIYHAVSSPGQLWLRPLEMFISLVPVAGESEIHPRFKWIREN
jgi:hypothetical protein